MSIVTGTIQFMDPNKYGYAPSIKVNGVKYGGDSKGTFPAGIGQGSQVEFESFDSTSNGKSYPKYKLSTLRLVAIDTPAPANGSGIAQPAGAKVYGQSSGGSRDTYWADKEAKDALRDPRIAYFAASERAIAFASLVVSAGALPLEKAKDTKRLDILSSFVSETTQRFVAESYAQTVPKVEAEPKDVIPEAEKATSDEAWA